MDEQKARDNLLQAARQLRAIREPYFVVESNTPEKDRLETRYHLAIDGVIHALNEYEALQTDSPLS